MFNLTTHIQELLAHVQEHDRVTARFYSSTATGKQMKTRTNTNLLYIKTFI